MSVATPSSADLRIGDHLDPLTLTVTPALNEQFLFAVEDYHPRYHSSGPWGGPLVHPAVLLNMTSWTRSPSFHLAAGSSIHGRDEAEFLRWAHVDEALTVSWTVVDRYARRERAYHVVEVVVMSAAGAILRRIEHSTIATGAPKARLAAPTGQAIEDHGGRDQGESQVFTGSTKRLAAARIIAFSGGGIGEPGFPRSNIHTSRERASAVGLSGLCASGGQCEAYLVELMIGICGEAWHRAGTLTAKFVGTVPEGAILTAKASMGVAGPAAGEIATAEFDIWCEREDGSRPIIGTATGPCVTANVGRAGAAP